MTDLFKIFKINDMDTCTTCNSLNEINVIEYYHFLSLFLGAAATNIHPNRSDVHCLSSCLMINISSFLC